MFPGRFRTHHGWWRHGGRRWRWLDRPWEGPEVDPQGAPPAPWPPPPPDSWPAVPYAGRPAPPPGPWRPDPPLRRWQGLEPPPVRGPLPAHPELPRGLPPDRPGERPPRPGGVRPEPGVPRAERPHPAGPRPGHPPEAPGPHPAPPSSHSSGPTSAPASVKPQPAAAPSEHASSAPPPSAAPAGKPTGEKPAAASAPKAAAAEAPQHEAEGAYADPDILPFRIPDAPYSAERFEQLHKAIDLFHGVMVTLDIFGVELAGLGIVGLGLTVLAPVAAFVGSLMAGGAAYADARQDAARSGLKWGFAKGFVAGADKASWKFTRDLFWMGAPEFNAFYPEAGAAKQKAFNVGLACGFVQGHQLTEGQKQFFWTSLKKGAGVDLSQFSGHQSWSNHEWVDYYTSMAAGFLKLYVKE